MKQKSVYEKQSFHQRHFQALQYASYFSFASSLLHAKQSLNLASVFWLCASSKRLFQSPMTPGAKKERKGDVTTHQNNEYKDHLIIENKSVTS